MTRRRGSSGRWLDEHRRDPFVKAAARDGYRSRASYKLLEIDDRTGLLRGARAVVDLGAAPGGWCQVVRRRAPNATVVGIDLLSIEPIEGVVLVQEDFTADVGQQAVRQLLPDGRADLVLSDMAPNISGVRDADQARSEHLVELALDFAIGSLRPGGDLLAKVFQGAGFEPWMKTARLHFDTVRVLKPKASRDRSRETYVLARSLMKGAGPVDGAFDAPTDGPESG